MVDNKSSFDRSFLLPIGIGIFSILGICLALSTVYLDKPQAATMEEQTATPFKYLLIATETPDSDLEKVEVVPTEAAPTQEPIDTPSIDTPFIDTPQEGSPTLPAPTAIRTSTPANTASTQQNLTATSTVTPISSTNTPNILIRYDDTDPSLEFDGDWSTDSNVSNAYQKTLSVSSGIGDDLIFTFTGQQIVIGYLGGSNLGTATVWIDGEESELDQSTGTQWVSPEFSDDEHFVLIIHDGGASINLDYINVVNSN